MRVGPAGFLLFLFWLLSLLLLLLAGLFEVRSTRLVSPGARGETAAWDGPSDREPGN